MPHDSCIFFDHMLTVGLWGLTAGMGLLSIGLILNVVWDLLPMRFRALTLCSARFGWSWILRLQLRRNEYEPTAKNLGSVHEKDEHGDKKQALHLAAEYGHYHCVAICLQNGGDTLSPAGRYGNETPLLLAERNLYSATARLLRTWDSAVWAHGARQRLAWAGALTQMRDAHIQLVTDLVSMVSDPLVCCPIHTDNHAIGPEGR
jgi:hypothetical protein